MKTLNRSAVKARLHLSERESKPKAHAQKIHVITMVNGRQISKSLADPDVKAKLKKATARMFPNREASINAMKKRGVLTKSGKLAKQYGG